MVFARALARLAILVLALFLAAGAHAQANGPLITIEAAGGLALTEPQSDRFGPGAAGAIGGYYAFAPWMLAGARLRGGFLSDSDSGVVAGQVDPGTGTFQTLGAMLRLRPFAGAAEQRRAPGLFLEGGPALVLTGDKLRAGAEGGLGFGIDLGGVALAPTVRYLQVVQPSDPLSDEDARVLLFGAELALLDARRAPSPPEKVPPREPPPPRDSDGDGLTDDRDACPSEPEDMDGHQDDDGCPERDNDRDGLEDARDRCPNEAEDTDGFEDEDGCPDPDNDRDTVLDPDDQCPLEPETVNGNKDYDGCPDEGLIEMVDDRIVLEEQVLFDFERARVRTRARPVLQAIVRLYKQHPEWLKIRIEGHADHRGSAILNQRLSERRAANVRKALIELGIPADMIESAGYGASRPRDDREDPEAYRRNRRVEFVVVARSARPVTRPEPERDEAGAEPANEAAPAAPAPAEAEEVPR